MIAIVDHRLGNFGSIENMLKKVGAEVIITSDHDELLNADKLVLPGVGAFNTGMRNLREMGLTDVLNEKVLRRKAPILGICLGMQMLTGGSEESVGGANEPGLAWIEAQTVKFCLTNSNTRLPHMGWNYLSSQSTHPLLQGLDDDSRFYFVHNYHVQCQRAANVLCRTQYENEFASVIVKDHIVGTQFHPEKSHRFGMCLMRNFVHDF